MIKHVLESHKVKECFIRLKHVLEGSKIFLEGLKCRRFEFIRFFFPKNKKKTNQMDQFFWSLNIREIDYYIRQLFHSHK